ncbi:MAG: hypothetical protein ACE5JE_09680 [Thermoplasmata archaeon]
MAIEVALRSLVVVFLAISLGIFVFRLAADVGRGRRLSGDFGLAFSAFITAWMTTELIAIFAPETWMGADQILHFAVLLGFAAWMNVRWRWALRRALEVS